MYNFNIQAYTLRSFFTGTNHETQMTFLGMREYGMAFPFMPGLVGDTPIPVSLNGRMRLCLFERIKWSRKMECSKKKATIF